MFVSGCTSEKNEETLKEWKKTRAGTIHDHESPQPLPNQSPILDTVNLSPEKNKKNKNFMERLEDLFKQRTYKVPSSPQKNVFTEVSYDDAFLISLPPLTPNQILHQEQKMHPLSTIKHVGETVDSSAGSNKECLDICNFSHSEESEFDILKESNFKSQFSLRFENDIDENFSMEEDHPDIHNFLK
jgi:hypothetical protein